ncbi:MAG: proton-conducting transporter membrane subunit [Vulcanimicrobiaceae bacterium]
MLDVVLVALAVGLAGLLAAIVIPGRYGRAIGFGALAVAGACASLAGALALHAPAIVAGNERLHLMLRADALAGLFIAIIGGIATLVGIYGIGARNVDERRTGRTAAATACAILFASILVCIADDVLLFLFAWELLALTFYWAIVFAGTDERSTRAGYFTLVVTHVAGGALTAALLLLARFGGFGIAQSLARASAMPGAMQGWVFVLLLIGFGAKCGMFPLHSWLRYGYAAAPSCVAALMAGGALNVGFYGIVRFMLQAPSAVPLWEPVVLLALGALGAFFGIAWAVGQHDARELAAYSSVENAGIILTALGIALAGRAVHIDLLVGVGLAAAVLQSIAHAIAKCALFLGCSTILTASGTLSFEQLGGLARRMPITTAVVLIAALSLAALPPMAGFVSEWMVLEALMQAFRTANVTLEVTFALCGALIGVAAGVAVVAFVKFVGIGMLGAARSAAAAAADETRSFAKRFASIVAGVAILFLGVFSRSVLAFVAPAIDGPAHVPAVAAIIAPPLAVQPGFSGFSSTSPIGLGLSIAGFTLLFWLISSVFHRPVARRVPVWTSGERYRPWTQYTGTGFANPTRVVLDAVIRARRDVGDGRYRSVVRPYFDLPVYRRIADLVLRATDCVRATQSGVIAAYLSYILVFTIGFLVLYPSIRTW